MTTLKHVINKATGKVESIWGDAAEGEAVASAIDARDEQWSPLLQQCQALDDALAKALAEIKSYERAVWSLRNEKSRLEAENSDLKEQLRRWRERWRRKMDRRSGNFWGFMLGICGLFVAGLLAHYTGTNWVWAAYFLGYFERTIREPIER